MKTLNIPMTPYINAATSRYAATVGQGKPQTERFYRALKVRLNTAAAYWANQGKDSYALFCSDRAKDCANREMAAKSGRWY